MKLICKHRFNFRPSSKYYLRYQSLSWLCCPPYVGLRLGARRCIEASNLNPLRFELSRGNGPEFCWRSTHLPLGSYHSCESDSTPTLKYIMFLRLGSSETNSSGHTDWFRDEHGTCQSHWDVMRICWGFQEGADTLSLWMERGEDVRVGAVAATLSPLEKNLSLEPTCGSVDEIKGDKKWETEREYTGDIIWTSDQAVPEACSSDHFTYMTYLISFLFKAVWIRLVNEQWGIDTHCFSWICRKYSHVYKCFRIGGFKSPLQHCTFS